jgi:hypothetical protein
MADAWRNQGIPVYSQSLNGIHEGHLPLIPSTPHTPHIQHSSSAGNLHAQATPFFGTPADLRSTQYVAYQSYLHPTPLIQRQWDTTSMMPETPSRKPVNKVELAKNSYRGRWSVKTKLAHILDAINKPNWSLADFLYLTFRVKDEKTDDGIVHCTKWHTSAVGRFMRGQDKYVISDIHQCWF